MRRSKHTRRKQLPVDVGYIYRIEIIIMDDYVNACGQSSLLGRFAQAGPNMLNRTTESRLAQADTRSEANSFINSYSFGQPGTSQLQNIPYTKEKLVATATNWTDRKKINDRAYRQRMKEGRKKLEDDCRKLCKENADLKSENESLKKDNDMMNENLQSATDETKQLKSEICTLKLNISHQQILVDAFSQRLINDDHQPAQLENKIAILGQNSNWDDWMTEKEQLLERIMNLEYQNKLLGVTVEALSEMRCDEKDNEDKVMQHP